MSEHFILPDVQAKPDQDFEFLTHTGKYCAEKEPDVIVCLGDFADMPSLSSYDKGKKSFEGRRYTKDIEAAREAMDCFLKPILSKMNRQKKNKKKQWKPRFVMVLGNHEERIMRAVNNQPELAGLISYDDLPYDRWEVYDFLEPVFIDGICYSHYMANPMTGKPYGGSAMSILKNVGVSYVVGHKQCLDVATRTLVDGEQQWGMICGAAYPHEEDYKGYQGNKHWRGIIYLHEVAQGNISPMYVTLDYLRRKYG